VYVTKLFNSILKLLINKTADGKDV